MSAVGGRADPRRPRCRECPMGTKLHFMPVAEARAASRASPEAVTACWTRKGVWAMPCEGPCTLLPPRRRRGEAARDPRGCQPSEV